jgi:hypothetical protein
MFDKTYENFHTNFDTAAIDICSNLMQQNANNPTLSLSLSILCITGKGLPKPNDKGGENLTMEALRGVSFNKLFFRVPDPQCFYMDPDPHHWLRIRLLPFSISNFQDANRKKAFLPTFICFLLTVTIFTSVFKDNNPLEVTVKSRLF